jgi:hypothetical protein
MGVCNYEYPPNIHLHLQIHFLVLNIQGVKGNVVSNIEIYNMKFILDFHFIEIWSNNIKKTLIF